jgi:hypothetical protein
MMERRPGVQMQLGLPLDSSRSGDLDIWVMDVDSGALTI